ncbi:hypothetical protein BH11PSE10_BH11PSE10_01310 [soil metagenome]
MNRKLILVMSCLLVLLANGGARAMDFARPCTDPRVFPGAALNAIVMPYRFDGPTPPDLRAASQQISTLVHMEMMLSMLKYGSVGAIDLVAEPGAVCDVDQVVRRVTRPDAPGALKPGQALVLLWGRLFEQEGELYVQSYLRFFRQGRDGPLAETLALKTGEGTGTSLLLQAAWPTQALAFAPRRISRAELARVDREFRQSTLLRERPEAGAPGRVMAFVPGQSQPYWVTGRQGDWLQLKAMQGNLGGGWIKATDSNAPVREWSLQRWLPELAFADAVNGMMRLRQGDGSEADAARLRAAVMQGLDRYESAVPADQAPTAWGLAAVMRAQLAWTAGQREEAARQFARARELLPAYAGARNLAAVTAMAATPLNADSAARLSRQLLAALAVAPQDPQVLMNLAKLYQLYSQKPSWSPFEPEVLKAQIALLATKTVPDVPSQ